MLIKSHPVLLLMAVLVAASGCFMRSGARGVYHSVRPGETLFSVARTYRTNYQELAEINNIQDPSQIAVGQRIFVPHARRSRSANNLRGSPPGGERLEFIRTRFIWPLGGRVTSPFGIRAGRKHDGVDIAAPAGTEIIAADHGKVVYAKRLRGYGNLILVKHSGNFFTAYAHNQVNLVREGQKVNQGAVIARVGTSGRAHGPHLHFEIRQGKKARNPLFLLPETAPEEVASLSSARGKRRAKLKARSAHAADKKAKPQRRARKKRRSRR